MVCVPRIFEAMPPGKEVVPGVSRPVARAVPRTGPSARPSSRRRDAWVGMADEDAYWEMVRGIWQDRPVLLVAWQREGAGGQGFRLPRHRRLGPGAAVGGAGCLGDRDRLMDECLRWARSRPSKQPLVYMAWAPPRPSWRTI